MRPVYQTRFAGPRASIAEQGNCFAACLASILECPLEDVDVLFDESGSEYWLDVFQRRLSARGFPYGLLMLTSSDQMVHQYLRGVPYIASGPSPRGDWLHSCVYLNGNPLHDPVRDGGGFAGEVQDIVVLVWKGEHRARGIRGQECTAGC